MPRPSAEAPAAPRIDPLMRTLPAGDASVVVVEWNAIRHSPLAEALLACRARESAARIEAIRDALGVDIGEDIDRIALSERTVAVSGYFQDLRVPAEFGTPTNYGDEGRLYELPGEQGFVAQVGDGLLVLGDARSDVEAAIDRVEGREKAGAFDSDDVTQNDVFGVLQASFFTELLSDVQEPRLRQVLEQLARGTLRVRVDDTLAISLDVDVQDAEVGEDLARVVGGMLAAARHEAAAAGEDEAAWLLEQARVLRGGGGGFGVDVALPGDVLLDALGCPALAGGVDAGDAPETH